MHKGKYAYIYIVKFIQSDVMLISPVARKNIILFFVHLIAWALLFVSPLIFMQGESGTIIWKRYFEYCVSSLSFVVVFYLNYYVLIDRLLFRQRLTAFILTNVLSSIT